MTLRADALTDLATIFEDDDFAQVATLADTSTINVFLRPTVMNEMGVDNRRLEISARYSDVSGLAHNATLVINSVTYYVRETPQDDGFGKSVFAVSKD